MIASSLKLEHSNYRLLNDTSFPPVSKLKFELITILACEN